MLKRTLVFSSPMILSLKNQQLVYAFKLWFDVEKRYKTICRRGQGVLRPLWFDVEKRYKTITRRRKRGDAELWFDVEKRYKTIDEVAVASSVVA